MPLNRNQDFMFEDTTTLTTNAKSLKGALNEVNASLADKAQQSDLNTTNTNVTQNTSRLNTHFINVLYPPTPLNALKGNGTNENMTDVQAIFDSIQNTGGIIFFPGNKHYTFTSTITIHDGTTVLGAGKNPTNGNPTILDFKAVTGTSDCFYMNGASDITLKDFYMYGTNTGSGNDISMNGYNRRINIENIILNTKTTGYGICAGKGGAGGLITSFWKNILVTGAGTGYFTASSCTSISLYNCYANSCTQYGYIIEGTYCSLHSCASDLNGLYGYVLQNANQVGLYSCGGESNVRQAVLLQNSNGIDIMTFRSHNNNTGASTFYPSFMDIQNSNRILLSNCQDSSPNASTTYSLTSTTQDSGTSIVILNPNFVKPVSARLLNVPKIDGSIYPGIIANASVGNNSIFIDSADNLLKLKNSAGSIASLNQGLSGATGSRTVNPYVSLPYFDTTLNKPVWCKTAGIKEIDTLTVSSGANASGNITITLNGVGTTVAVTSGDTAGSIGDKIRATVFSSWTVGGTTGSATVTFTKNSAGTNSAPTFADTGTTGTTASFVVTTAGTNNVWVDATGTAV